jgi:hypothetical protein
MGEKGHGWCWAECSWRAADAPLSSVFFSIYPGFPDNINFSDLRTIGLTILGCELIESLIDLLRGECMYPPFG